MVVSSLPQTQDLLYPLQDQSIFSPETSVNQTLQTIIQISDDTPKKSQPENLKAHDAPINYRSKYQNSFVGFGVLMAIALTAIYIYVEETWISGVISVIGAVVMITAFWLHLFEDDTFSRNESRKMHRITTCLLYTAFLLSLASFIVAMVNITKVYKAGDPTVTEDSSLNSISDNSNSTNSTNSTSDSNSDYLMLDHSGFRLCLSHNLSCAGTLESSSESFGEFLSSNPILIAMLVLESVQFILYCVLLWNTWSFGKVLGRMQQRIDGESSNKNKLIEMELTTFSKAAGLIVNY